MQAQCTTSNITWVNLCLLCFASTEAANPIVTLLYLASQWCCDSQSLLRFQASDQPLAHAHTHMHTKHYLSSEVAHQWNSLLPHPPRNVTPAFQTTFHPQTRARLLSPTEFSFCFLYRLEFRSSVVSSHSREVSDLCVYMEHEGVAKSKRDFEEGGELT